MLVYVAVGIAETDDVGVQTVARKADENNFIQWSSYCRASGLYKLDNNTKNGIFSLGKAREETYL
ncbi:hypothetical protein F9L33_12365 [Amylibacter sp. SFDW26]|uniref:hypothetical protein n=1 Tax=Amylibacter sp. SFDW26 TaxID=2652722 RepID=UPI00126186AD|nr:hypothetical protein [Amylibacter sp. SFDW26]KAB7613389.1 hypothetical protein F9L33_12365 [Amylibacter sp. SFDW26]